MIIILSGKAQSGKTTAYNYLKTIFDSAEVVIAKPLKDYTKQLTDWDGSEENKPRSFLQDIGNHIRFEINKPNFLIQRACEDIQILEEYKDLVVVTDCRFKQELYFFKAYFPNCITVRLERPNYVSTLTKEQQQHITEVDLDDYADWDYVVKATNVDELKNGLNELIQDIGYELD